MEHLKGQPFIESVDLENPGAVARRLRSIGRDDVEIEHGQPLVRVIIDDVRLVKDFPGLVTAARVNTYYDDRTDGEAVWDLLTIQLGESLIGPGPWTTEVVYDHGDFVHQPRRPLAAS